MEIKQLTEEELQMLISRAHGKAEDWLFGTVEDVYLLNDNTLVIDFKQGETRRDEFDAGIVVTKNKKSMFEIIKSIALYKIENEQTQEGWPDNIL